MDQEAARGISDKTCEICSRSFARNEHLVRHRRIHTSERPFGCPFCQISFPRADVKEKHMRRFHTAEGEDGNVMKRQRLVRQERSKLACDQCRKKKLKCNDQRPCQTCQVRRMTCTVSSTSRGPGRPRNDELSQSRDHDVQANTFDRTSLPVTWDLQKVGPTVTESHTGPTIVVPHISEPQEPRPSSLLSGPGPPELQQDRFTVPGLDEILMAGIDPTFQAVSFLPFEGAASTGQDWEDVDFMDAMWQLPPLEVENWLEGLDDFAAENEICPPSAVAPNNAQMDNAIGMMVDHFRRRSRAASPDKEEARRLWYSAPPRLQIYDKEVINVFLNLARNHLSTTFPIFSDFEATTETSHELCLAMASVGALFSAVDGSTAVAKALHNDARRMHLENVNRKQHEVSSFEQTLSAAKTIVLLEIYGICSGDKRSYEFVEAFHSYMLQAIRTCWRVSSTDSTLVDNKQLSLISEAVDVLEGYRVLLLLRPPCFLSLDDPGSKVVHSSCKNRSSTTTELWSLMSPVAQVYKSSANLRNLAKICSYIWMSSPRGQERLRKRQLWKPEFIENALQRWLNASMQLSATPEFQQMLLYHLVHIQLYSNLGLLQHYAHHFIKPPTSPWEKKIVESLNHYVDGPQFKIAFWHANTMLRLVKEASPLPHRRNQATIDKALSIESPHLPYCIYFATLVAWYGTSGVSEPQASREVCLEAGVQLLFMLKVRVSKVLGKALYELTSERNEDELR